MIRQKTMQKITAFSILFVALLLPMVISVNVYTTSATTTMANTTNSPQPATTASYDNIYIKLLNHTLTVQEFGMVDSEDIYIFGNNGSSSILSLSILVPTIKINSLIYSQTYDKVHSPIQMVQQSAQINEFTEFIIMLNEPFLPNSEMKIFVKTIYSNEYFTENPNTYYAMTTEAIPVSPYPITDFNAKVELQKNAETIRLPSDELEYLVEPEDTSGGPDTEGMFTNYRGSNIDPFTYLVRHYTWTDSKDGYIQILNLNREISVNQWGYIRVVENQELQSHYYTQTHLLTFYIPKDVWNVSVYDSFGAFTGVTVKKDGSIPGSPANYNIVQIELTANRALLNYGNKIQFSIEYQLSFEKYTSHNLGKYNLKLDLLTTKSDFEIEECFTTIHLKSIGKIIASNVDDSLISTKGATTSFTITSNYLSLSHQELFDVTFTINRFYQFSRAFLFFFVILAILSAYALIANKNRDYEGKEDLISESIPISELSRFVELYEEKNAILIDFEKADSDLLKRRIQKKAYNKLIKSYTDKMKGLDKEILPFKTTLLSASKDFRFIIEKLDYLEAEKLSVKDSITMLTDRYKKGKLPSKAAYEKLSNDLLKRMKSAQNKIDRYIHELRAYLV
ncbi:MAG: hypothetical protein ACTSVL_03610 [Promethearchaeota archaeon]